MCQKQPREIAIGIDLGTTNCCCYCIKRKNPEPIPIGLGINIMPSVVSFENANIYVGAAGMNAIHPEKIVCSTKRLMGQLSEGNYKVRDQNKTVFVEVDFDNKHQKLRPEEIAAILLDRLKINAEKHTDATVTKCVITVPAAFNENQRLATRNAAKIAGMDCLTIINEPTAAALGYIYNNEIKTDKPFVVFDIGGGTCDISVARLNGGLLRILKSHGDTHLGGNDFDQVLLNHFVQHLKRRGNEVTEKCMHRLREHCCKIKESLSMRSEIEMYFDMANETLRMSRSLFNFLCTDLLNRINKLLLETFDIYGEIVEPKEIEYVILVGGTSNVPIICENLRKFFPKAEFKNSVNPAEVVALGAVLQAAKLFKPKEDICKDVQIMDISPMSLGVEIEDHEMEILIKKNTPIPTSFTKEFTTCKENQTMVTINVFQGEKKLTSENIFLGTLRLNEIPPAPAGKATIKVTFTLDVEFLLHVSVKEMTSGKLQNLVINRCGRGLTNPEITLLRQKFKEREDVSARERSRIDKQGEVSVECTRLLQINPLNQRCQQIQQRILDRPNEPTEVYEQLLKELSKL